jgi:hypothetical protein
LKGERTFWSPLTYPSEDGDRSLRDRKPEAAPEDPAWERYMASYTDYIKRQLIVYQNWPQRRWEATGYRPEKVFTDLNN